MLSLSLTEKQKLFQLLRARESYRSQADKSRQILVAFVTGNPEAQARRMDFQQLKQSLRDKLPGYAIPVKIYPLECIPKLASGKIDKSQLKALAIENLAEEKRFGAEKSLATKTGQLFCADLSAAERKIQQALSDAWEQVLGCPVTSLDDNFFELGGDSILSIHVISRLLQAGYKIGPNDLFESPEFGQLIGKIAASSMINEPQVQLPPVNYAPITPIQSWFFNTVTAHPEQWNMARLYKVPQGLSEATIQRALHQIAKYHDVFRICFIKQSGDYKHVLDASAEIPLSIVEMPNKSISLDELNEHAALQQDSLSLGQAPLISFVLFKTHSETFLLVTAHHLVMDIISWQILKQDLQFYLQPANSIKSLVHSTPFTAWADYQKSLAEDAAIKKQIEFWDRQGNLQSSRFPFILDQRSASGASSIEANIDVLSSQLDQQSSQALKHDAHQNYQTTPPDLLLTAFALAILERFAQPQITIDVESHGRFDPNENIDLSRTIGWFSCVYPLLLSSDPHSSDNDSLIASTIKTTKEKLKRIKHGGIAFGLLKQTNQLKNYTSLPQARILFNYMGNYEIQVPESSDEHKLIDMHSDIAFQRHPKNQRSHFIEMQCYFRAGQFHLMWHYDRYLVDREALCEFAEIYQGKLQQITRHCNNTQHGSYTPSDFPDAELDQQELDDFLDSLS